MNLIAQQKHLNLVIREFSAVTCHNQPADARAFLCIGIVFSDGLALLLPGYIQLFGDGEGKR